MSDFYKGSYVTLYILDLQKENDAVFYQYLNNLEINIISKNPLNNNNFRDAERQKYNIKVTSNEPSFQALDCFNKKLFYLYDIHIKEREAG